MLMYALSTVAMNHRGWFESWYGEHAVQWDQISEERYHHGLTDPARSDVANQILSHLDIEGAHDTRGRLDRRITITRDNPWDTRRITWSSSDSLLTVERRKSRLPVILESLHRRRGFQHDILTEDLWAASVDIVILAMIFWAGSGVWMWWEMSATRKLGTIALASGFLLYAFFLVTI